VNGKHGSGEVDRLRIVEPGSDDGWPSESGGENSQNGRNEIITHDARFRYISADIANVRSVRPGSAARLLPAGPIVKFHAYDEFAFRKAAIPD
jgi:hypothetical protein